MKGKKSRSGKEKIIVAVIVMIFIGAVAYFFISSETLKPGEIPSYVTGEVREVYEWAKTTEGSALLEQIPCYCGCKYEGHRHSRDCFWRDDGTFDKHGITCSVCLDIGKKAREMHEEEKDICEIRNTIDSFYQPNKHLGTETPMPPGCVSNISELSEYSGLEPILSMPRMEWHSQDAVQAKGFK